MFLLYDLVLKYNYDHITLLQFTTRPTTTV